MSHNIRQRGAAGSTERDAVKKERGTKGRGGGKKGGNPQGQVYLPHPRKPGKAVDFGVRLEEVDGQLVLSETMAKSLAHQAGICHGDVLVDINGTNIEGCPVQNLLDLLREMSTPELLLTVKRQVTKRRPTHTFVWTYFRVVNKGSQAGVRVLYLTHTDKDIMPWIHVESSGGKHYVPLGEPFQSYDIQLGSDYLSIDKDTVKFVSTYDSQTCMFNLYKYVSTSPPQANNGIVVVYALQHDANTAASKANPGGDPIIYVTKYVPPKGRQSQSPYLWYQKADTNGEFSLQNVEQEGWYLAKSASGDATLSQTPTQFSINPSDVVGRHC